MNYCKTCDKHFKSRRSLAMHYMASKVHRDPARWDSRWKKDEKIAFKPLETYTNR